MLFALPTSLLLLTLTTITPTHAQKHPSPRDLSPEFKYYPEHAHILQRDLDIKRKLQWQNPIGVRKLGPDPGEKFYLDYWIFDEQKQQEPAAYQNNTAEPIQPGKCLRRHYDVPETRRSISNLWKRDFDCPSGSTACTAINRPDSCCASGTTCQLIPDVSGSGDVGCCPSGQTCGTVLGNCRDGSTECASDGGGCCLDGYACFQAGCVQTATTTVLVGPSTSATSATVVGVSTTTVTSITTITPSNEPPQVVTTTVVIVDTVTASLTDEPETTTQTESQTSTTTECPEEYTTCPESLGGGCCHSDRQCATGSRCPAKTTSGLQPPDRPTSDTTSTYQTESSSSSSLPAGACPTGFYACKAFHQGGCCETDRDCDTTSCPPLGTTTVVNTDGVTVVAPTGVAGADVPTGTCRSGWISCAASLSGGCCPTGYRCEVSTCTADSSDVAGGFGKIQPESSRAVWGRRVDVVVAGFAVILGGAVLGLGVLL